MSGDELGSLTKLIRYFILTATTTAGSGHPTSSLSAVELMATIFFKYLRADLHRPKDPNNDRVIFSKGHATPLLYALYAAAGVISPGDLAKYRTFASPLEGHPSMRFPYTEVPTGSLGQGLSVGVGEALALRMQHKHLAPRVYVLLGDGELVEGSAWEAASWAAKHKIDNLIAIADINRLGQSEDTMYGYDIASYQKRFAAFGWRTITLKNGNSLRQVDPALGKATKTKGRPTILLARTVKGKGVSFLEGKNGWHGKALSQQELILALKELGDVDTRLRGVVAAPERSSETFFDARRVLSAPSKLLSSSLNVSSNGHLPAPVYDPAKPVATRKAFGNALARIGGAFEDLVVFDGDVKNSTYTEEFEKAFPHRFFQMYIAEQNMVGVATGFAARGFKPVAASFACFLTRAHDQIRMAAISQLPLVICGSHAGVSIGEDGPSQMGLEDLALFRSLPNSVVVYPADAMSSERLTEELVKRSSGLSYIRTTRPATPILYTKDDQFLLGGSKEHHVSSVRNAGKLAATIVAAGITLHEALKAQTQLAVEGIAVAVLDCYSVKPIDGKALRKAAKESKSIVVVEDHYPEGGLGDAVTSALADTPMVPIKHLAVGRLARSGKADELLDYEGISAKNIARVIKGL